MRFVCVVVSNLTLGLNSTIHSLVWSHETAIYVSATWTWVEKVYYHQIMETYCLEVLLRFVAYLKCCRAQEGQAWAQACVKRCVTQLVYTVHSVPCMQELRWMQVCAYTRMHACGHLPTCMHAGIPLHAGLCIYPHACMWAPTCMHACRHRRLHAGGARAGRREPLLQRPWHSLNDHTWVQVFYL